MAAITAALAQEFRAAGGIAREDDHEAVIRS
jgi:hypothetical protein